MVHFHTKRQRNVGVLVRLRTLALGIDVKWGCPSNTTSCVHGHTYWICVNFLLRGLSWECLLLESEVWGQIRFLKGTGNGGWSMKTKFYPKSMDPHWMRVYVGVHSLYFDTKLQAPVNGMDAKKSMLSISMFMHQSHFWSGHWTKNPLLHSVCQKMIALDIQFTRKQNFMFLNQWMFCITQI